LFIAEIDIQMISKKDCDFTLKFQTQSLIFQGKYFRLCSKDCMISLYFVDKITVSVLNLKNNYI